MKSVRVCREKKILMTQHMLREFITVTINDRSVIDCYSKFMTDYILKYTSSELCFSLRQAMALHRGMHV